LIKEENAIIVLMTVFSGMPDDVRESLNLTVNPEDFGRDPMEG
jgi:hypothetical protein